MYSLTWNKYNIVIYSKKKFQFFLFKKKYTIILALAFEDDDDLVLAHDGDPHEPA